MATFGQDWVEEPTPEEKFEEIVGYKPEGNVYTAIQKELATYSLSKEERRKLLDIRQELE